MCVRAPWAGRIAEAGRPVLRATLDDFKKPWKDRHLYDRESGEGYYRNVHGVRPPAGVDGVFAFRPEIDAYWDFRIWLEVDAELSVRRGAERDQDWAGADAESLHRDRYLAAQRVYLAEVDPLPRVDLVIDNSEFARPRVLAP
ncbi:hypothetical protein ACZ90_01650 [Streptomyces albus subsp. albus]|nr:hypothetical protein ACZ90_01650 [Streptomyces albus subsp. albus]